MNFSDAMIKLENVSFNFDLSEITFITCKTDKIIKSSLNQRRYLLLCGDTNYNLSKLYKKLTKQL